MGFTFVFLESKAKFTHPYPPTPLLLAQEKRLSFSFPLIGLATFVASSALLWTRPSPLSLAGGGAGKEETVCLGPYAINDHHPAAGLQASLSHMGPSLAHSRES